MHLELVSSVARRKQQWERYLAGEAWSPYSHTPTLKIALTEDDSQAECLVDVGKGSASSTTPGTIVQNNDPPGF